MVDMGLGVASAVVSNKDELVVGASVEEPSKVELASDVVWTVDVLMIVELSTGTALVTVEVGEGAELDDASVITSVRILELDEVAAG